MSYRLESSESLSVGIRRIATEQITAALHALRNDDSDLGETVHETRKRFKKIRALLRLIRKEVGEKVYQQENSFYRAAGRQLAPLRDSHVLIDTLDSLTDYFEEALSGDAFQYLREQLVQHEQALRQQDQGEGTIAEIAAALDEARQRVATWPLDTNDFSALQPGLQRSYKRGRKRLAGAYTDCTPVAFHEWRKCVKDLGYQLRMLKPIWPELIDPLIDELHTLSDDLGDDHDLDQLCAVISAESNLFRYQNEREALAALITQRRLALEARARPLGVKLYAEAPAAFVERHAVYWQAWQGEAEDEVAAC